MASKLDLPLHGSSLNIVKQFGPGLSDIIKSKFGCMATFDGVNFEKDQSISQQKRPTVAPEKRLEVKLRQGVRLSVWKADLTDFRADAVVNAANSFLQHCGGLALALSTAGGPQIQKDSEDYIKKNIELKTGHATVTAAGNLPYQKIIHAVGPQLSPSPSMNDVSRAEPLLEKTIRSILDKVREHRLSSVAIPAISSGLFYFPLPLCADVIVKTVKGYYENSPRQGHFPQEIFLVNHDEPSVKEMERACNHMYMSYSQAAASKSKGAAETSTPTVKIGNVHLILKKGKIEQQQTDVIVNTVSSDRNLRGGQISTALLEKAGYGMQNEINNTHQSGNVITTSPHRLGCKQVYHTFCPEKVAHGAQQILFNSVSECLSMAASRQHKSIAFPAIGTGGLGFNKKEVARIMSNAAFEEQMRSLQHQFKASDPSLSYASGHEGDVREKRPPTPKISLTGPSDVAIREAERWLSSLLSKPSDTVIISNNFIQYFGEAEYQQLSRLNKRGVSIKECFENSRATIIVHGDSAEDVVVAGLKVEAMLCKVQREFVAEEEGTLRLMSTENVSFERKTVDSKNLEFSNRSSAFRNLGLQIVKVEKVKNVALRMVFDLKKKQLGCSTTRTMLQRIPPHFCEMVSHVGFHAEYAPPHDPAYGEGIYFAGTVKKAMEVWKEGGEKEEYLYFVEAEVLTGNSTRGKSGLILPPPQTGTDPQILYDSVDGGADISVVFSGYQALPRYIITCKKI
eukprot:superscaffoldBa00000021_g424